VLLQPFFIGLHLTHVKIFFMRAIVLLAAMLVSIHAAQAQRVKRKNTSPIDVSKEKTAQQATFSLPQLTGKWIEVQRAENGSPIDFADSIWLYFPEPGKALTRAGKSVTMSGEASIEPGNLLIAAGDAYKIISLSDSLLVLDNQEGLLHRFKKNQALKP
jgi:hypothetical protein